MAAGRADPPRKGELVAVELFIDYQTADYGDGVKTGTWKSKDPESQAGMIEYMEQEGWLFLNVYTQGEGGEAVSLPSGIGGGVLMSPDDPGAFYGDGVGGGAGPQPGGGVMLGRSASPSTSPVAVAGAAVTFAVIVARLGGQVAQTLIGILRPFVQGALAGVVRFPASAWAAIPGWLRTSLVALGFVEGADLLIEFPGEEGGGLVPLPWPSSGADIVPGLPDRFEPQLLAALGLAQPGMGVGVVKVWNTQPRNPDLGTWMVKLSDGRGAARKNDGTWKIFRYIKPVVLTRKSDLGTLLRADRLLASRAKSIKKFIDRHTPKTRGPSKPRETVVVTNGKVV